MTPEQASRMSLAEQHEWFARATGRRSLLRDGTAGAGRLAGGRAGTSRSAPTPPPRSAQSPAFHLHAGDISYAESGGGGLSTDSYDPRLWDSFFTRLEPGAGAVPWQVAVGNHEMEAWYSPDGYGGQQARFNFPGEVPGASPPAYYSFGYGNVAIISLDANDVSCEIPANNGYSGGASRSVVGTRAAGEGEPALRGVPGHHVEAVIRLLDSRVFRQQPPHGVH